MEKYRLAILSAIVVSTILGSAFLLGLVKPASSAPAPSATFEYRAKWICDAPTGTFGIIDTASAENIGLVPGEYKTDINVHNPSHSLNVTISKKFVVSSPELNQRFGPIASARASLPPDGAFFIDCRDIFLVYQRAGILLCPASNFTCAVKGFVVLSQVTSAGNVAGFSSASSLDVVAEYSSESFAPAPASGPFSDFCSFPVSTASLACVTTGTSLDVVPIPASPFVA